MADDYASIMRAVELAGPDDPLPLVVAADWLDEHDRPDLAYALRWAAGRRRRPYRRPEVSGRVPPWQWLCGGVKYQRFTRAELAARQAAVVPATVFGATDVGAGGDESLHTFHDAGRAYGWLAAALGIVRADAGHPDLPARPPVPPPAAELIVCPGCGLAHAKGRPCPVCARGGPFTGGG